MKTSLLTFLVGIIFVLQNVEAQTKSARKSQPSKAKTSQVKKAPAKAQTVAPPRATAAPTRVGAAPASSGQRQLTEALALVRSGQYQKAAPILYTLSKRPEFESERMQIKYILGTALSELGLHQTAAFQFVDVIRNGGSKYVRQSIERLSLAADTLGDDTLLNYAVSKVRIDEYPENQREIIYYRLGEIKLRNGEHQAAADLFSKVSSQSRYALTARFNRGLALLEGGKAAEALPMFQSILKVRMSAPVTDVNRVAAQLAIARTYYQMQDWDRAIAAYREIPRDSEYWHDALFESSWATLRGARFRSTLSNLQSLHSAYYEDTFVPESLLVRSIVYLYICKFDETEKTLELFEKQYAPVRTALDRFLQRTTDSLSYFQEAEKVYYARRDQKVAQGMRVPYMIAKAALDEGNVKRVFGYLKALHDEKTKIESLPAIQRSSLGAYAMKVLASRFKNSKNAAGDLIKAHMVNMKNSLTDFFEQASFVRYEMINGKKEILKKKIAGKGLVKSQIDEDVDRVFYSENGYEYWPFQGEYWLDEIGNYHYLGQQSCE
jgi:tetratricopeptide (TPR) repeat protein